VGASAAHEGWRGNCNSQRVRTNRILRAILERRGGVGEDEIQEEKKMNCFIYSDLD
jgi:hypothetical protein